MLKNILKINGVQEVTKNEQKTIQGGGGLQDLCAGPGTGGYTSPGVAAVCAGYPSGHRCYIWDVNAGNHGNGCPAECAGGSSFWYL